MSEPTVDELRAQADRDETLCRLIERHLGREFASTLGIELPPKPDVFDELASAQYGAEFAARRLAWLESRLDERNRRAEANERIRRDREAGISRFIPPGLTLDDLADVALSTPAAVMELQEERVERQAAERQEATERVERELAGRGRA